MKLNIIDTPGHADFGGEVERGLTMVDGVLLLVDASEGPLPQTRFVLRKALEARLPVILVVNKVDRPDARVAEVVDEVYELFLDLDADEQQIEFPIVYCNAQGRASPRCTTSRVQPLEGSDARAAARPAARAHPGAGIRPRAPAAGARHEPRRLALRRAAWRSAGCVNGTIRRGQQIAWCRADGAIERAQVAELYVTDALDRVDAGEAGPGEIIARRRDRGGDDRRDARRPEDPRPLPVITVDEPAMSITIGVNTSPLAGKDGDKLDRPPDRGAPGAGARRQRLAARRAPPSARTPTRCRAAASCSWRCSSR